jgi:hypothetical protein
LIIIIICLEFISNIDIDFYNETGIFNLTLGETYKFYVPAKQLAKMQVKLKFDNYTYLPFNCVYIDEYSYRNGSSMENLIIAEYKYNRSKSTIYNFDYDLVNFSSTYVSFAIKANSSIEIIKNFKIIF